MWAKRFGEHHPALRAAAWGAFMVVGGLALGSAQEAGWIPSNPTLLPFYIIACLILAIYLVLTSDVVVRRLRAIPERFGRGRSMVYVIVGVIGAVIGSGVALVGWWVFEQQRTMDYAQNAVPAQIAGGDEKPNPIRPAPDIRLSSTAEFVYVVNLGDPDGRANVTLYAIDVKRKMDDGVFAHDGTFFPLGEHELAAWDSSKVLLYERDLPFQFVSTSIDHRTITFLGRTLSSEGEWRVTLKCVWDGQQEPLIKTLEFKWRPGSTPDAGGD